MARYLVNTPLRKEGKTVPAGGHVTMESDDARALVRCGALSPAGEEVAPAPAPPPAPPPPPPPPPSSPPPPPSAELPDEAALGAMTKAKIVAQAKAEELELDEAAKKEDLIKALLTARKPAKEPTE